jgi:hypothetical protein
MHDHNSMCSSEGPGIHIIVLHIIIHVCMCEVRTFIYNIMVGAQLVVVFEHMHF